MSLADKEYLGIVKNILENGALGDNRTGMPAYKLPHQIMQFDLEKEFPILTTKFVAFKTSVKEILWIWQKQSNDVRVLQDWNCHVWDEWMREDGTIGKAYGYQLGKYHQVDTLLETLKKDPQSRRMVVDLWNVQDLPDMALYPCAFLTMWDVSADGRLNCMLVQRSGDMGLGVPFNMAQYAALVCMIAQVSGLRPGLFTHVINNAHVYENHKEQLLLQLSRLPQAYDAPKLVLNSDIKNFYDFKPEDIVLKKLQASRQDCHGGVRMSLSIIVAKASNNAIGKDNALLWHLSDDLKRFKKLTMGHPIIMGRKTFESLPGVLPGRVHYVLTGNKDYKAPEGVLLFHDVKSLMESLPEGENFVIGGEHMYKALLPYAGALYITEVEKPFDGDAFFPEIRPEDWVVTEETEGEGNIPHRFITYHRK